MAQIHIPFSREMAVAVMEGNKVATTPQPQQELIDHMKQHMKNMVGEYPDQYHEILCAGMLAHIDALSRPASIPTLPRDAVLRFSRIMETKLCEKDSIRDGWEDCDPVWLFERAEGRMTGHPLRFPVEPVETDEESAGQSRKTAKKAGLL